MCCVATNECSTSWDAGFDDASSWWSPQGAVPLSCEDLEDNLLYRYMTEDDDQENEADKSSQ